MVISNLKKHFCELLKKHIRASKVKQLDIAAVLNISPSAVSQMLSGSFTPKLQQLDAIMQFLQLDRTAAAELRDCLARIRSGDQELRSPLNDFIKSSRTRCGLTIEKLSQMSGIPIENLNMLENKLNVQPTPYEAVRLATIFSCNISELWQVVPDFSEKNTKPAEPAPDGTILRDYNAPYRPSGKTTIKLPIIKIDDLLEFNPQYDHLIDFSWRHMIGVENGEKVGLVIVSASGTEFGWSDLYDIRMEIAEIKQWLPGMMVLSSVNGELVLARTLNVFNEILIQGSDEPCRCDFCWLINELKFISELFNVTAPERLVRKQPIAVFGKKQPAATSETEE